MRKLVPFLLVVSFVVHPLGANELSVHTLQSGTPTGAMTLFQHGLHGEGELIAILDTGLDWDNCFFAEANGSAPPINTGSPSTGFAWSAIDLSRRKVVAYDFLFSCAQFPGSPGCDNPQNPADYDNQGHGTHAAGSAVGDSHETIVHDFYDAIAPGAKLVVQDAGYVGGDYCSQFPGLGCPITRLTAAFDQAYAQGVRIHSNSWGDRQMTSPVATPPTGNYATSSRDVDAFAYSHPDFLIVFNTGNAGQLGASSLSAPGDAKNTLNVGGTRYGQYGDDTIAAFTGRGPTRDGRLKPDVVGPAFVTGPDSDFMVDSNNCAANLEGGTSWSSPTIAGAAALVRQYYRTGFYPSGAADSRNAFTPSAALLKATIIAGTRSVRYYHDGTTRSETAPAPTALQGWGFPVLGDVLRFAGDQRALRIVDTPLADGVVQGEERTLNIRVAPNTHLRAVLVWTDPAGVPVGVSDTRAQLVNDLDLSVTAANGTSTLGNHQLHPGQPDRLNNVELVDLSNATGGTFRVTVKAATIRSGSRQSYALVLVGDFASVSVRPRPVRR